MHRVNILWRGQRVVHYKVDHVRKHSFVILWSSQWKWAWKNKNVCVTTTVVSKCCLQPLNKMRGKLMYQHLYPAMSKQYFLLRGQLVNVGDEMWGDGMHKRGARRGRVSVFYGCSYGRKHHRIYEHWNLLKKNECRRVNAEKWKLHHDVKLMLSRKSVTLSLSFKTSSYL